MSVHWSERTVWQMGEQLDERWPMYDSAAFGSLDAVCTIWHAAYLLSYRCRVVVRLAGVGLVCLRVVFD